MIIEYFVGQGVTLMKTLSNLKNFGVLLLATLLTLRVACAGQWQITYAESGNFSNEEISVRHQDEPRDLYSGGNEAGNSLYSLPLFENYSLSPGENGMTNVTRQTGDESGSTYPAYFGEISSVRLDWNSYSRSYNSDEHYRKGATAGYANGNLSVHPVFHWVRNQVYDYESGRVYDDPGDNPPQTILYAEHATVSGGEFISHNNGYSLLDDYNAGHPFKGSEFTFSGVSNPLSGTDGGGDFDFKGYHSDWAGQYQGASYGSDRLQITKLDTGGSDEVDGPTRAFSGAISLNTSYGELDDPFQRNGSASINFNYNVTSVNFGLSVNGSAAPPNSDPLKRDIDAFVSRGYKGDKVAEHADVAFWEGRASFDAFAAMGDYSNTGPVWPNQTYKWTVGPDVYLPEFPAPTEEDKTHLLPDASVTHKDFAWDFGDASSADGFPRTGCGERRSQESPR